MRKHQLTGQQCRGSPQRAACGRSKQIRFDTGTHGRIDPKRKNTHAYSHTFLPKALLRLNPKERI